MKSSTADPRVQRLGSLASAARRKRAKQDRLDVIIAEAVSKGAMGVREVCALVRERSYHEGFSAALRSTKPARERKVVTWSGR